ncbi:hypothetical protein BU15DRAFT_82907 [Melanogaster broomeanus]|nr:hypothetical protein BU15DRAFT_82907 [Melanogaster broomeanus]
MSTLAIPRSARSTGISTFTPEHTSKAIRQSIPSFMAIKSSRDLQASTAMRSVVETQTEPTILNQEWIICYERVSPVQHSTRSSAIQPLLAFQALGSICLRRLAEWADNPATNQRVCWLSGVAGSGKSAIAQSIAEQYARQNRLAASFFFSRKEISRRTAQRFFPTLASQMLVFAPSIKAAVIDAVNEDYAIPTKVLVEQMRRLLQKPMSSVQCSFPDPVLVVIDSLDECEEEKMANEVVVLLADLLCTCHWPLRVLLTSRHEPHIVQTFHQSDVRSMTYALQLQDFNVQEDIRYYLSHSFAGIRQSMGSKPGNSLPWPAEDDVEIIMQKSAGLFIFATTVVKFVGDKYHSPPARLQAVLQGGVSTGNRTRLVLGFVVFAFSPLSTRGLNTLLWNFQIEASFVIRNLHSVLVSPDTGDDNGPVRIYHTSFRDFLSTSHRSREYFADSVTYHRIMAQACLESMIRHLAADMRVYASFVLKRAYVMLAVGFARVYLLNWIEVLSLMGELESGIISLRGVADWLKSSLEPHQETLALLQDAERLVLMFFDPIQQAALQVYYSVPYCPNNVQLRTTYQRELTNKFIIPYGLDDQWSPCLCSVPTSNTIVSLAVSSSGSVIASAGATPGVQLWDSLTGKNLGHFTGTGYIVMSCHIFSIWRLCRHRL